MSDRTSRISTLDRVISYFSPTFGIKRIRAKAAIDAFAYGGGGYTGAKTRHGLSNTVSVGDDTDHSLSQLRSYSRSLVTYTTIGAGAVFLNASNTIGSGLKMQPSIVEGLVPLSKTQIEALQTQIKQRWKLWAESTDCDYNGQFTFNQLQFLIYLSKLTSGDVLVTLPMGHEDRTVNGLKINIIEADRVRNDHFQSNTRTMVNGVKLDAQGRPIGVFVHPGDDDFVENKAIYIPFIGAKSKRRNAFLCYTPRRPREYRGRPFLAPVTETIKKLDRYFESEITASEVNSLFGLFIKTPSGDASTILGKTPITRNPESPVMDVPDYSLEPGVVLQGRPGDEVQSFDPARPNSAFGEFIKSSLVLVGMGLQIPYEILIQFFSSSYSASKAAQNEYWKTVRRDRNDFALFCQHIYEEWLTEEVLQGRISCPGFFDDIATRRAYCHASWVGIAPGQINPAVEVKAAIDRINGKLSSRKKESAALGFDLDEVLDDLHDEMEEIRSRGLENAIPQVKQEEEV